MKNFFKIIGFLRKAEQGNLFETEGAKPIKPRGMQMGPKKANFPIKQKMGGGIGAPKLAQGQPELNLPPPQEKPMLGEKRIIDGREYVFLETTPGKPRWHTPEEVQAINDERERKNLQNPEPKNPMEQPAQKPTTKLPHEMSRADFEQLAYQTREDGTRGLDGRNLAIQPDKEGKFNVVWEGKAVKTGISLAEAQEILRDPYVGLGGKDEQRLKGDKVVEKTGKELAEATTEKKEKDLAEMSLDEFEKAGHEPHEVTQKEWTDIQRRYRRSIGQTEESGTPYSKFADYEEYHRQAVKEALAGGKAVSVRVLKDYPEIQKQSAFKTLMETQAKVLKLAEIPEKDIPMYALDSVADGAKLRTYSTEVIKGDMTPEQAAEKVKADYEKMKAESKENSGKPVEKSVSSKEQLGETSQADSEMETYKPHPETRADDKAYKEQIGTISEYAIWEMDGKYIRDHINIDYVEGGNPGRYKFVPEGEIWLESEIALEDFYATMIHEYIEVNHMIKDGMTYDKAHDKANEMEREFRKLVNEGKTKATFEDAKKFIKGKIEE